MSGEGKGVNLPIAGGWGLLQKEQRSKQAWSGEVWEVLTGLAGSNSESVVPGGRRDEETFLQAASTIIRPETSSCQP